MPKRSSALLLLCCTMALGVVIDRIAVVVGKHVIKSSDIERDLRVTEFLNRDKLDLSVAARRKAAERLIDQSIIRDDMERGEYRGASPSDTDAMLKSLTQDRFAGSEPRLKQDLAQYSLTEEQLQMELQWQGDVLKFLDQRFRPGVVVTDEEVRTYYDQHQAELKRQFPQAKTYEALEPKIRSSLEGERLNTGFETWLANARKRTRIDYRQGAFQ